MSMIIVKSEKKSSEDRKKKMNTLIGRRTGLIKGREEKGRKIKEKKERNENKIKQSRIG